MAHQYVFTLKDLKKIVPPKREILKGIWLSFFPGAKIGVLGANGAGKSTLLRIMAGVDTDYLGEVWRDESLRIGYLPQEPQLDPAKDVRGNVDDGVAEVRGLLTRFDEINARLGEPVDSDEMEKLLEEQATVQDAIETHNGWDLDRAVEMAMDALRVPPGEQSVTEISGGERRRVALCRLLLAKPDILLLDEPTNHLDAEAVAWLEHHLKDYKGTIIAVTHDRYFLDNVAGWILELDRGQGIPWKGNYTSWLDQKGERLRQEEKSESDRQKTLKRELEWIRMGAKARQAKGKARISAYENLLSQENEKLSRELEIYIPPGARLGNLVIEAKNVTKAFGDKVLLDNVSFSLPPGGIVGIIGPNGAGKTTLFKMITGEEKPDSGEFRVGDTVQLSYSDQSRSTLTPGKNVWEVISGGMDIVKLGKLEVNSRAYVARFNFSGQDQQKKVENLSGGERNRVHLAVMLKEGGNVLLLDEPTNDLDVNTMRALEEALENFGGCAVIISHDRWFLDRVATHILAFEGESKVAWFEGNFSEYEADRHARLGTAADTPHRIKYKKLTRP